MDDFLWRALIAGISVALVTGPLGAFIVWRRMAFFGDTLAHSALLGIAMGILLGLHTTLTMMLVCLGVAVLVVWLERILRLSHDTLLGILAHSALSLGLVALSLIEGLRVDLMAYLFGDILSVTQDELIAMMVGCAFILGLLLILWKPLVAMTVDEDLARVEGMKVGLYRFLFMTMMAMVVALAMKLVGVLLITSLLIIPAAVAARFARSPEQMAVMGMLAGCLAVMGGMGLSLELDTPAGPSIVVIAALMFLVSSLTRLRTALR